MGEWSADWCNDPYDDYNLYLEVLHDVEHVADIRKGKQGLEIKWYPHKEELVVPLDWFLGLLEDAKRDLIISRIRSFIDDQLENLGDALTIENDTYGENKLSISLSGKGYITTFDILLDLTYDFLVFKAGNEELVVSRTEHHSNLDQLLKVLEDDMQYAIRLPEA